MNKKHIKILEKLKSAGLSEAHEALIRQEMALPARRKNPGLQTPAVKESQLYGTSDADLFLTFNKEKFTLEMFTLDELIEKTNNAKKTASRAAYV